MLVHICCSVDSHYFLSRLQADFPNEKLVGYFYNPNIFPKSEYDLRFIDVKRSCERLGIELFEGEYDDENWALCVRGLECEPEKGARCEVCFDIRFEKSAEFAKQLGLNNFTSTLLQSPLKDKAQLKTSLKKISNAYGVDFVFVDYLSDGGKEAQSKTSNEEGLYRQNYCGCVWGVINQRGTDKIAKECFSPLDRVVLPSSSEKRIGIYGSFADKSQAQKSIKSKILNFRLLFAKLIIDSNAKPSLVLAYSKSSKSKWSAVPEHINNGIAYFKKEHAKIIDIHRFASLCHKKWSCMDELLKAPPSFEEQIMARFAISGVVYDTSPIFVTDTVLGINRVDFELDSAIFEDSDETI